ncbi:hypothetical protein RvY_12158-2 [Ramazzottius varieornatus]|uniref:Uncharacterized protein n=1 Tax=Ramazzottius varieornatus TaxID=947166 RepID=A0A1D1VII2_RAMVA|nr:hypothetical protein RvY_12158-2 [Ramazzottius varieornatus]
MVFCCSFFPESPLFWVVNVNREKEADSVVGRIARWNAVKLPLDFCVEPSPLLTNSLTRTPPRWQGYLIRSWTKIMYNPFIFRRWLYVTLTWFVVNYIWVSVSITRAVYPFSLRWNFAIIGVMAMLGGVLTQMLLRFFKKMEIIVAFLFSGSTGFLVDAYVMPTEGLGLSRMTTSYTIRSTSYCVTAMTTLSMLGILRLQSAEIRGEECQPGAIFWMILCATTGGAVGMYYKKTPHYAINTAACSGPIPCSPESEPFASGTWDIRNVICRYLNHTGLEISAIFIELDYLSVSLSNSVFVFVNLVAPAMTYGLMSFPSDTCPRAVTSVYGSPSYH